ncbi:MAG: hypothetical protein K2Y22_06970 [Candidatus Obscuribacterales bacterium]|nr:hypothetical protein [Candidatus Obscuribacterales bacterium]
MSSDNAQVSSKTSYASRLFDRVMTERKKEAEKNPLGEVGKFAQSQTSKEPAGAPQN